MNNEHLQVLGGDFNAEPHEESIRLLSTHWSDAYAAQYPESDGYTFPTNDPIKRIDYFFVNKQVNSDVSMIGSEPTEETMKYIEVIHTLTNAITDLATHCMIQVGGTGMLDENAPQYASDHLGLKLVIEM